MLFIWCSRWLTINCFLVVGRIDFEYPAYTHTPTPRVYCPTTAEQAPLYPLYTAADEHNFTMGGQVSKLMGKIFGSKEMRLLMLGLDAAGKTSMVHPGKKGNQGESRAYLSFLQPSSSS